MLQESIHKLQGNSTQQKRLRLSIWLSKDLERLETLLNSASIFPYFRGLTDNCRDPLDLEIAAELFLKISWTVNGVSGKVVLDETLIQRQAIVSAKLQIAGKGRYEELRRKDPANAVECLLKDIFGLAKECKESWFSSLPPRQHLFVDSVLQPIFSQIVADLSAIFSPALPDIFYMFVEDLVSTLAPCELTAMNQCEPFQMFRDVAQATEDSLVPFNASVDMMDMKETVPFVPHNSQAFETKILPAPATERGEQGSISTTCMAVWNHQELLRLVDRVFSDTDTIYKDLQREKAEKVAKRFACELETRNVHMRQALEQKLTALLSERVSSLQLGINSTPNIAGLLGKIESLSAMLQFSDACRFVDKSADLVTQSKKAVANYRRLKLIMKDESDDNPEDKETQQQCLFQIIASEAKSISEFAENRNELRDSAELQRVKEMHNLLLVSSDRNTFAKEPSAHMASVESHSQ
ncbi:hypothetical protein PSACC_00841 [Paramicrosporidium saccamoebae]|uniref:Uncharacterized protein n=1 Tax=Paramicrosporidium saccamoebae TaxID=1246581 RepID=A0A2H9TNP4_9FUNG|nr:hypothetical protein PSACC_00841 [Paramicrosporidium saccamoebae]